ncbi:MAG: HAMP domain-containing protein, partial [Nitrospirae bacterium]|nr:HAMP domain-containing protein [Nitrospirota bacterium]
MNHIGVGKKIAMGFGLTTAVMLLMMCVVNWRIDANNTLNARVIDLRQPTVIASTRLLNGVNQSLAGLRGYMILGKDSFKAERADGWREINDAVADLDRYAQGWTNADNVERLARIKQSLTAFAQAQREIEDISQTPDNTPATRILVTQAAPLAKVMIAEITTMIDIEAAQPATAERKALLGMMADVRGSTGMALANIRAFLLTGDDAFRHDYNTFWTRNEQRFADLSRKRGLLTGAQRDAFDKFSQARDAFKGLPPQMFEIRSGEAWNLANLWLGTKAAPEAAKIKGWLGEMVEDQRGLANTDSTAARQSMDNLKVALFALGALALGLAVAIAWGITRMITRPLAQMLAALEEIADGDGDLTRRLDERRADEIGAVAVAFNRFTDKIRGVVVQVSAAASAIGHGTQEMATGNADLSQRTEEQASALEETASSMEQMTANVRQSADNAAKANQMAVGARSQAEHGGRVVADA